MTQTSERLSKMVRSASMSGYGRGVAESNAVAIEVELRAVNSRFLDLNFKMPRLYMSLEPELRSAVSARLSRGKVDVMVTRTLKGAEAVKLEFNRPVFDAFWKLYADLCKQQGIKQLAEGEAAVRELLMRKEIAELAETSELDDAERAAITKAFTSAVTALTAMRVREGARLGLEIASCAEKLSALRDKIAANSHSAPQAIKQELMERLSLISSENSFDQTRLATEVALLADRVDVSEELTRLISLLAELESTLGESPQGKKLDYLVQELGREFNTITSKTRRSDVQLMVVEAKVLVERVREQVQNIE